MMHLTRTRCEAPCSTLHSFSSVLTWAKLTGLSGLVWREVRIWVGVQDVARMGRLLGCAPGVSRKAVAMVDSSICLIEAHR